MSEPDIKTFTIGVPLRRTVLRSFTIEIIKFSLWFFAFLGTIVVVRYSRGGGWARSDTWGLIGVALGVIAMWSVSVARTISAAYREFKSER